MVSEYEPVGDQPRPIADLESGGSGRGARHRAAFGATGTGKSATTAWLIEKLQRPTLVMAPNKTLAAQLANELREMLPHNAVEYFVSYYDYYQPEAYIAQTGYLHREGQLHQRRRRAAAALSATLSPLSRRDVVVVASVLLHLRPGHAAVPPDRSVEPNVGDEVPRDGLLRLLVDAVHAQRYVVHAGLVPGPRRHRRDHPVPRGTRRAHRVLRRRGRGPYGTR